MQGASQTRVLWDSAHVVWFIGLSSAILVLKLSACQPSVWDAEGGHRGREDEEEEEVTFAESLRLQRWRAEWPPA